MNIEEKIERAESWSRAHGEQLRADPEIGSLLARLEKAVNASHEAMAASGMIDQCRWCEEEDGGSCCGAGLENRYDEVLLLINLLMDAPMPRLRSQGKSSCLFLGPEGCLLKARQVICVHYLCDLLQKNIDRAKVAALQDQEGEELDTTFQLHTRISEWLKKHGDSS